MRTIFSEIAPRYDLLNHVLSLNIDRRWRRDAVDRLQVGAEEPGCLVLDACAGTYDLSLELAGRKGFSGRVVASDFAGPMLVEGLPKLRGAPISPVCGDSFAYRSPTARSIAPWWPSGYGTSPISDAAFRSWHGLFAPAVGS
ncbi:MAG: class I SAM-dependent methyltransferase [Gemmatimonadota bacterium]